MKDKWNYVLVFLSVVIISGLFVIYKQNQGPCTLSFKVYKGYNFNQPYPTYTHCVGSEPAKVVIWYK